jgi:hypothetical protein
VLLEHAILLGLVLVLVALLTPVVSEALRSVDGAIRAPFRAGGMRIGFHDVLVIPPGSATPSVRGAGTAAPGNMPVVLSRDERVELEWVTKRWLVPARDSVRARALLLAADGASDAAIARQVGAKESAVAAWRNAYMARPRDCRKEGGRRTCRRRFASSRNHRDGSALAARVQPEEERA